MSSELLRKFALNSEALHLREICSADLAAINSWRNSPQVVAQLGCNFLYIDVQVDEQWLSNYQKNRDTAVRLVILAGQDRDTVGCVNLTSIHRINRSAEFSIVIGTESYRGHGYGSAASMAMLRHAFEDLNLWRVYLFVLVSNQPARRLYDRLGFVEEGQLRSAVYKSGAYQDLIVMSILRPDYERLPWRSLVPTA